MGNILTTEDQHIACCLERRRNPPATEAEAEAAFADAVLLNIETEALTRGYI